MVEDVNAADPRPTRLRALFDRIGALPDAFLDAIEGKVTDCEHRIPPLPGTTRTVAGATITDRPDLVYQGQVATPAVRTPAAEVAPEGMSRR